MFLRCDLLFCRHCDLCPDCFNLNLLIQSVNGSADHDIPSGHLLSLSLLSRFLLLSLIQLSDPIGQRLILSLELLIRLLRTQKTDFKANDIFLLCLNLRFELLGVICARFFGLLLLCSFFIQAFELLLTLSLQHSYSDILFLEAKDLLLLLTDQGHQLGLELI